MKSSTALLAGLVVAHVAFGYVRLPASVVGRRLAEVAACRRDGYVPFVLGSAFQGGEDAIAELLATTSPDAVIPIRGLRKGAIEFAPALLWPRLCCATESLPAGAVRTADGRPIAQQVLVADGASMRLEPR